MSKPLLHTPEGVRDIYGREYASKLLLEEKLRKVISSYGYQDIQTPTFEFFDVFSREIGTTPSRELYKFFDKDGNTLVLRPDFTPSMARCAAKYFMDETLPIRFCYMGNTFTNSSSLQGKLKEVTELGAELILEPTVEADAEMISMMIEALKSAGLQEFQISVGEMEFFKGICSQAGLGEDTELELRNLISNRNYFGAEELLARKEVRKDYRNVLLRIGDLFGSVESLQEAKTLVNNERSLQAVERLESLYQVLCGYGVSEYVTFDLGLLSKYNYYTGVVFKAYTYGVGEPVARGGRYDNLLGHFGKKAPAIGFMVVIDDLLEALSRQHIGQKITDNGVLLLYEKGCFQEALAEAKQLRQEGCAVELMLCSGEKALSEYQELAYARRQDRLVRYTVHGRMELCAKSDRDERQ